jgi:hypothetical protein
LKPIQSNGARPKRAVVICQFDSQLECRRRNFVDGASGCTGQHQRLTGAEKQVAAPRRIGWIDKIQQFECAIEMLRRICVGVDGQRARGGDLAVRHRFAQIIWIR